MDIKIIIKREMKRQRYSYEDLAKEMRKRGFRYTRQALSKWLLGQNGISEKKLKVITKILKIKGE